MDLYVGFSSGFCWGISVALVVLLTGPVRGQVRFEPPVQGPWALSGTFGELRNNHFHAGLDFKTGGKEGLPILAAADGCLSRIRQGAGGYGLALYIDHDSLFTTVYAHLHHAEPAVAAFLDSLHYAKRRFEIDTTVATGRFCYQKGDRIGFSGNTGSSDGPHLHFEIRDRNTQEPLNPWLHLNAIGDTLPPVIQKVALYIRSGNRFIRDTVVDRRAREGDTLVLRTNSRECALGMAVTDPERLGIYRMDWSINDAIQGGYRFDRFNFNETRYVSAHVDRWQATGSPVVRFHRLFRLPGDSCSVFRNTEQCVLKFDTDSAMALIRLFCSDVQGNRDSLLVQVVFLSEEVVQESGNASRGQERLSFGQTGKVHLHNGVDLFLSSKALYQDEMVDGSLRKIVIGGLNYHPVLPDLATQFHEPQSLSLPIPERLRKSGPALVAIRCDSPGDKVREVITPVKKEGHHALFKIRSGGWYALSEDKEPPRLEALKQEKDSVDSIVYAQCRISDDLSGIARYDVFRNHRWILAEYDAKSGRLRWNPGPTAVEPQLISIVLEDKCGNGSRLDYVEFKP